MKRVLCLLMAVMLLAGCKGNDENLQRAMAARGALQGKNVQFSAVITADYGDESYTFTMECAAGPDGELSFTVTEPESLKGISGTVSGVGGKLTFDDLVLAFDTMAEGRITPVSAPWVMMKALRSGYLTSCCLEEELLRVAVEDSFEDDALRLDIWLDKEDRPVMAEVYWEGRRLLTIAVADFRCL